MSLYHVTFWMPPWVAEGIAEGIYEVVGGVVRLAQSKEVVLWLRPALDQGKSLVPLLPRLPLLAGGAALTATAAVAAGAAVVALAGIAYIADQNQRIADRLKSLAVQLEDIKADTSWLKKVKFQQIQASVKAALQGIDTEEQLGNWGALQPHITTLRQAQDFYLARLDDILKLEVPLSQAEGFGQFAFLYVLATQAKARALTLYVSQDAAITEQACDAEAYAERRLKFIAPIQDPEEGLAQLVRLSEEEDRKMQEAIRALPSVAEAEFLRIPGLVRDRDALTALRSVSAPSRDGRIAAIIPAAVAPPGWRPEAA